VVLDGPHAGGRAVERPRRRIAEPGVVGEAHQEIGIVVDDGAAGRVGQPFLEAHPDLDAVAQSVDGPRTSPPCTAPTARAARGEAPRAAIRSGTQQTKASGTTSHGGHARA
jgi:hypothetical protein